MNDSRKNYEHHEEFDLTNYHTNSCYNMDFFLQNSYLKEVVHYNSSISNIGLDNIKKCSTIQPQQLAQPFGPHCEELWSIT